MAEVVAITNGEGTESATLGAEQVQSNQQESHTPTIEELMSELSKSRAEVAKWKNANDKSSQEAASYKKQLKAKMTIEEQDAEAKAEAERQKDEQIKAMSTKLRTMEYSKKFMGIGTDEKTAESLSQLTGDMDDPERFFSELGKFVNAVKQQAADEALQKFLKERPEIKAGVGGDDKNAWVNDLAKEIAHQKNGVNKSILEHYL